MMTGVTPSYGCSADHTVNDTFAASPASMSPHAETDSARAASRAVRDMAQILPRVLRASSNGLVGDPRSVQERGGELEGSKV